MTQDLTGNFCRNEDDVTVKLTEMIFTNTLIKTGLVKGVPTQNIMVSLVDMSI